MKLNGWMWAAVVVAVIVGGGAGTAILRPDLLSFSGGPYSVQCSKDGEIPAAERAAIESAGLGFARAVLAGPPEDAYGRMSAPSRATVPIRSLAAVEATLRLDRTFASPVVARSYFLDLKFGEGHAARIPCGTFDDPHHWDAVALGSARRQAHVLVTSAVGSDEWSLVIWMVRDANTPWQVDTFTVTQSRIAGLDGEAMWRLAQAQRRAGHDLMAYILYLSAGQLLERGAIFQSGIKQDFDREAAAFPRPASLKLDSPWPVDGTDFMVSNISLGIAQDRKLLISIDHPTTVRASTQEIDRRNRAFVEVFIRDHPEWSEVFDHIVVRAFEPDGKGGYATVYDKDGGFR